MARFAVHAARMYALEHALPSQAGTRAERGAALTAFTA